ncbi:MAG: carboxy-S-adenosyl-L-methionine synthase CmoA [Halothiobacillus sp. 14-56-357]|jgi:tRNA (cmo5U34)-methyltransferase|uniref:carboxy-S-adenosyl-L-methionine synthase CmoA n=1 Tax=Halothiobacillus sp. 15-55-196 TaxID=1970382 RepID=UPI000BD12530|nr:carboxy-S-adenosyl-L-methionine synthase CmoA [Halothiobacillus sp. 15-55-196]OZB36203.1 MAG: carboxy-S-adenosyl-L-methionine synthase CmoA [Halothiobacillus sp. 15-55-196]OZB57586.1 MAG: carboxy-S-adenosyl-L-methionine synthase CmoA [Halothiobacillus sp. 14-56-357]OZB79158.1 MAG: carboxy-S-adenosyl-L-methionine synthase CmoA [Halothiobacillus sp. 13-55-115]
MSNKKSEHSLSILGGKDKLFDTPEKQGPFCFNQEVAAVFPDMIKRSVPGYAFTLDLIKDVTRLLVRENSRIYDLGCSLGTITLALRSGILASGIDADSVTIHAIDSSQAMISRAEEYIGSFQASVPIVLHCGDITTHEYLNSSLIVLAYTLQFIEPEKRLDLLKKIHAGLNPGGGLILVEKIHDEDDTMQAISTELHHEFKRRNGYSELEIAQKRQALENVLRTETEEAHKKRFQEAGFSKTILLGKHYAFASWLALK